MKQGFDEPVFACDTVPVPLALSVTLWKCQVVTAIGFLVFMIFTWGELLPRILLVFILLVALHYVDSIYHGNHSARRMFTYFSLVGSAFYIHQYYQLFRIHPYALKYLV